MFDTIVILNTPLESTFPSTLEVLPLIPVTHTLTTSGLSTKSCSELVRQKEAWLSKPMLYESES
jgi:hypothetical protein